jgi:hypothetical protein
MNSFAEPKENIGIVSFFYYDGKKLICRTLSSETFLNVVCSLK